MANNKINIGYFTTSAELHSEGVGREIVDPETNEDYGRRLGNLEHVAQLIAAIDNQFSETFNLVGIFIDGPEGSTEGLWPQDMVVPVTNSVVRRPTLEDITHYADAREWRHIPSRERSRKKAAKLRYEQRIADFFIEQGADLIISDSYMNIAEEVLLGHFMSRALNLHPAILDPHNPGKLPGPTPTRDAVTRARYGFIIVDDKKKSHWPEGEVTQRDYNGENRDVVLVRPFARTGTTVHVMTTAVDEGPIVHSDEYRFNPTDATEEWIRTQNYAMKRQVLPEALLRYASRPRVNALIAHARDMAYDEAHRTPRGVFR